MLITSDVNCGVSASRNHGIRAVHDQSQYITFLDSDHIWSPEFLTDQLNILEHDNSIALLGCDFDFINEFGENITPEKIYKNRQQRHTPDRLIYYPLSYLWQKSPILPSSWVIRTNTLKEAGFFNEKLKVCEDHEMILRLTRFGHICENTKVLMFYRKYGEQLTSKGWRFVEDRPKAFEAFVNDYPEVKLELGKQVFSSRLASLHASAADHYFWNCNDYATAKINYFKAFLYSPLRFRRITNLLYSTCSGSLRSILSKIKRMT